MLTLENLVPGHDAYQCRVVLRVSSRSGGAVAYCCLPGSYASCFFNEVMPHGALNGRTPDEVYFGRAEDIPTRLATARKVARQERLAASRALSCEACVAPGPAASEEESAA